MIRRNPGRGKWGSRLGKLYRRRGAEGMKEMMEVMEVMEVMIDD